MVKQTTKNIEPILISTDQASIDRQNAAVNNGLPFAKAVFDAYQAIPGVDPLTSVDWPAIFFNTPEFIQNVKDQFYENNYSSAHEPLGFSKEKGMSFIEDKLPKFDNFLEKLDSYFLLMRQNYSQYATYEAYKVEDGQLVINQQFVDKFTNSAKLIFSTETEMRAKKAVDDLVAAILAFNTEVPKQVFQIWNGGHGDINLNQLTEVIDVKMKIFYEQAPADPYQVEATPNMAFYQKLNAYVLNNKLK